jgi:hypothetical protein
MRAYIFIRKMLSIKKSCFSRNDGTRTWGSLKPGFIEEIPTGDEAFTKTGEVVDGVCVEKRLGMVRFRIENAEQFLNNHP